MFVSDCDSEWQWQFPRPQPACLFVLRLIVTVGGDVDIQPLKDAYGEFMKGDSDVPECVEGWWALISIHFSTRFNPEF